MTTLFAPDQEATDAIGAALAKALQPGDTILLHGDLGAGKSALARAMIRARLGDPDLVVPSPTFSLVQPYRGILHADLYRLSSEDELYELGLFDDENAILIIEWPERAPSLASRQGLDIALSIPPGGKGRHIVITPRENRSIEDLQKRLQIWTIPA